MSEKSVTKLINIGETVAAKLYEIGISSEAELRNLGALNAYKALSKKYPDKHLPICYYLYSLEGAIKNIHWDDLTEKEKTALRLAAEMTK